MKLVTTRLSITGLVLGLMLLPLSNVEAIPSVLQPYTTIFYEPGLPLPMQTREDLLARFVAEHSIPQAEPSKTLTSIRVETKSTVPGFGPYISHFLVLAPRHIRIASGPSATDPENYTDYFLGTNGLITSVQGKYEDAPTTITYSGTRVRTITTPYSDYEFIYNGQTLQKIIGSENGDTISYNFLSMGGIPRIQIQWGNQVAALFTLGTPDQQGIATIEESYTAGDSTRMTYHAPTKRIFSVQKTQGQSSSTTTFRWRGQVLESWNDGQEHSLRPIPSGYAQFEANNPEPSKLVTYTYR